jgi:hypothetical protein
MYSSIRTRFPEAATHLPQLQGPERVRRNLDITTEQVLTGKQEDQAKGQGRPKMV